MFTRLALSFRLPSALMLASEATFRLKLEPTSILVVFDVLISRSSQWKTIFFSACSSMSPSLHSTRNFYAFTSKVMLRFPDLSAMTIFSSPDLSHRTIL